MNQLSHGHLRIMTKSNRWTHLVNLVVCLTVLSVATRASELDTSKLVEVGRVKNVSPLLLDKIKGTLNQLSSSPQLAAETVEPTDSGALWSIARRDDSVKVGVHIPIVLDLTKHEADKISKLDLSILGGLFSLTKDKSKQPNGSMSGPTSVSLFGIPIYSKTSANPSILNKIDSLLSDNQIIHPLTKISQKIDPEVSRNLLNNLKQKNQKVMSSLFDNLLKITGYLSNQLQATNINGDPITDSSKYVSIPKIIESDLVPKNLPKIGN